MPIPRFWKVFPLLILAASAALAQNCTFTLLPSSAKATAQGGDNFFDVSVASSDCVRSAIGTVDWISVSFGQTGSGNGRIGYTVKPNTLGQVRVGNILVNSQIFTVTQDAAVCSFTFTPAGQSAPATGGSFKIAVATSCTWTATSSDPWITIVPPTGATGNGSVSFNVAANTAAASRAGSIAIGGKAIPVSQAGAGCTITLPAPGVSVVAAGQNGSVVVTANSGCAVTATSDSPWITITVTGTTVAYTVAANNSTQPRTGHILIGGQSFAINQAGGACAYSITPLNVAILSTGGTGRVDVTTGDGCAWTVQNNAAFITNIVASAMTGPGAVTFTVAPNTATIARSGTLTIAGLTATVSQMPPGIAISDGGIVNGATFVSGPVAPGEILSIFGSSMGPSMPVTAQLSSDGRSLTTALAGTRVLFDGNAAPMIFTSDSQVSAVAPYAIAGNATTRVQVEYQGVASDPVVVNVATASPGLFALNSSGSGQGAVLNQDFSVNGPSNPAAAGSILMIYATGEGQTTPSGVDGRLTGDVLPMPVQGVKVQIGGQDSQVLYAGGAPGLVAGVLQVNVRLPDGITGNAVPVLLSVGSAVSLAGVTVAIQ